MFLYNMSISPLSEFLSPEDRERLNSLFVSFRMLDRLVHAENGARDAEALETLRFKIRHILDPAIRAYWTKYGRYYGDISPHFRIVEEDPLWRLRHQWPRF